MAGKIVFRGGREQVDSPDSAAPGAVEESADHSSPHAAPSRLRLYGDRPEHTVGVVQLKPRYPDECGILFGDDELAQPFRHLHGGEAFSFEQCEDGRLIFGTCGSNAFGLCRQRRPPRGWAVFSV